MDFPSPAVQHTHVNIGTTEDPLAFPFRTNARHAKNAAIILFSLHHLDGNVGARAGRNARSHQGNASATLAWFFLTRWTGAARHGCTASRPSSFATNWQKKGQSGDPSHRIRGQGRRSS